jgi:hypothetical protein
MFHSSFSLALIVFLLFSGTNLNWAIGADGTPLEFSGKDLRQVNTDSPAVKVSTSESEHLVVMFLSAKCPCSISHMEEIKSLATDFASFKFVAINSNVDEPREMGSGFFSKAELSFPVLRDENLKYADLLKAAKTPHAFVLNKSGEILYQGGVSDSAKFPNAKKRYLREALEDLKSKQSVKTPIARSLGCAIARSN